MPSSPSGTPFWAPRPRGSAPTRSGPRRAGSQCWTSSVGRRQLPSWLRPRGTPMNESIVALSSDVALSHARVSGGTLSWVAEPIKWHRQTIPLSIIFIGCASCLLACRSRLSAAASTWTFGPSSSRPVAPWSTSSSSPPPTGGQAIGPLPRPRHVTKHARRNEPVPPSTAPPFSVFPSQVTEVACPSVCAASPSLASTNQPDPTNPIDRGLKPTHEHSR